MKHKPSKTTATCPFTVIIDGREKAPYRFSGLKTDASKGNRELIVATDWGYLKTGDYSIVGLEDIVTVERKSLADLYQTLGQRREQFQGEHERMAAMEFAIVVVEASWFDVAFEPPGRSKLRPKSVFRTAVSWQIRYGIPWVMADSRRFAEIWTFRYLEKVWKHRQQQSCLARGDANTHNT